MDSNARGINDLRRAKEAERGAVPGGGEGSEAGLAGRRIEGRGGGEAGVVRAGGGEAKRERVHRAGGGEGGGGAGDAAGFDVREGEAGFEAASAEGIEEVCCERCAADGGGGGAEVLAGEVERQAVGGGGGEGACERAVEGGRNELREV
jgi:hypothetical protein